MADRCHWLRTSEVPEGRVWIPGCWGGLYGPDGCYCPPKPRETKDAMSARIDKLEQRLAVLEGRNAPA